MGDHAKFYGRQESPMIQSCLKTNLNLCRFPPFDLSVCPKGVEMLQCDPLLCRTAKCPGQKDVVCRVNLCGKCEVEFLDKYNRKVQCKQSQWHMYLYTCYITFALMNPEGCNLTIFYQSGGEQRWIFTEP